MVQRVSNSQHSEIGLDMCTPKLVQRKETDRLTAQSLKEPPEDRALQIVRKSIPGGARGVNGAQNRAPKNALHTNFRVVPVTCAPGVAEGLN